MPEKMSRKIGGMHDYRSDLMSGSPAGMAAAVALALSEPPAFGHREDPFQARLESAVAEQLGFEDALLVPTCTIANQIALKIWAKSGRTTVVADRFCHLLAVEGTATQILNEVQFQPLDGQRGHLSPQQVASQLAVTPSSLIWLENTHMAYGGTVMPRGFLDEIGEACGLNGTPIHIDGSRIWNAVVYYGAANQAARGANSLSLSLTKALGAPAGSMLLGSKDFIRDAVEVRSSFGAAWRPIGAIAAAGLHVLNGYEERLAKDHQNTKQLGRTLKSIFGSSNFLTVNDPDTNILLVQAKSQDLADAAHAFLTARGVLTLRFGIDRIRLVVHARTGAAAVRAAEEAFEEFLSTLPRETNEKS